MELHRVTTKKFKQALEAGEDVKEMLPLKAGGVEVVKEAGSLEERILQFTISTNDIDRDNDTIDQNGWELDNFNKGGSVLWAHSAKTPAVAKPLATWLEDGKLKSRAQFTPKDMNPFGFMIFQMYFDAYMRGCSVGFIPKEWKEVADRAGWYPLDFMRQELLEYSCTPVPSNPNALAGAKSAGIDVSPMIPWTEALLDGETKSPEGLFISKELAESLYGVAKGAPPVVSIPKSTSAQSPVGVGGSSAGTAASSSGTAEASLAEVAAKAVGDVVDQLDALIANIKTLTDELGAESKPVKAALEGGKLDELLKELGQLTGRYLLPAKVIDDDGGIDLEFDGADPTEDDPADGEGIELEFGDDGEGIEIDDEKLAKLIVDATSDKIASSMAHVTGRVD